MKAETNGKYGHNWLGLDTIEGTVFAGNADFHPWKNNQSNVAGDLQDVTVFSNQFLHLRNESESFANL